MNQEMDKYIDNGREENFHNRNCFVLTLGFLNLEFSISVTKMFITNRKVTCKQI